MPGVVFFSYQIVLRSDGASAHSQSFSGLFSLFHQYLDLLKEPGEKKHSAKGTHSVQEHKNHLIHKTKPKNHQKLAHQKTVVKQHPAVLLTWSLKKQNKNNWTPLQTPARPAAFGLEGFAVWINGSAVCSNVLVNDLINTSK